VDNLKSDAEQYIKEAQQLIKELRNVIDKAQDLDGWDDDTLEYTSKRAAAFNHYYLSSKLTGLTYDLMSHLNEYREDYDNGEYDEKQSN
jgi:hypothetical protein